VKTMSSVKGGMVAVFRSYKEVVLTALIESNPC